MNKIDKAFKVLSEKKQTALIPFITAGFPKITSTLSLLHTLADNGADLIEVGVPFSDPMADGKIIQIASQKAIDNGTNLNKIFKIITEFRKTNKTTPIILMTYVNPIEYYGYEKFAHQANLAEVDGVLTVDLPLEYQQTHLEKHNIYNILLASPTTSIQRLKTICSKANGFIYYVSIKGTTGTKQNIDSSSIHEKIKLIQKFSHLPIAVGFGIKDATTAKNIAQSANAVVIGSAIIELIQQYQDKSEKELHKQLKIFTQKIKQTIN